ncbi:hypothetical protein DV738_g887, partial [Chaetothyriales sp. CBS 135597]
MESSRRRLATYGKSNRRAVVHDLFNVSKNERAQFRTFTPESDESGHVDLNFDPSRQLAQELAEVADASTELDPSKGKDRRDKKDAKSFKASKLAKVSQPRRPPLPVDASPTSVFEIDSSSDEKPGTKPRNGISIKKNTVAVRQLYTAAPVRDDESTSLPRLKTKAAANRPHLHGTQKSAMRTAISKNSRAGEDETEGQPRSTESQMANGERIRCQSSPEPPSSQEMAGEPMSPKSGYSSASMESTRSTPKRKRQLVVGAASDVSSPSRLKLSSLLLSPAHKQAAYTRSADSQATETLASNPRQQLAGQVDSVDQRPQSQVPLADASDDQPRPKKSRKLATTIDQQHGSGQVPGLRRAPQPDPRRAEGTALATGPSRLRTYGKQRSHLKDMVVSEDSRTSSQSSLQELVSQVEALTATKSPFDMDDESDDDEPTLRPKSIHELRHGGLAERFNMDLDSVFDDIDSGNKSLRIQGLMSLVRKLQEKSFKAHLLASGKLTRLVQVAVPHLDLSSAMLVLLALWALCVDETATCQALVQIYGCLLHLPSVLVTEGRGLYQIAKDGKENLSKALVRDIANFEQHVIDKSVQTGSRASCIVVSRVGVRCLSLTLQRIIRLEGQPPEVPARLLRSAMICIRQHLTDMASAGQQSQDHVESIRLLLSWLERTAATSDNISQAEIVEELGTLLEDVMRWASKQHVALEQSSIRIVVELSNRHAPVCRALANTPLLSTLLAVVDHHFARLESRAHDSAHPDQSEKLDSAILALGCLLNLAESSAEVRLQMATNGQIDRLVRYFNVFVDQVDEAITEELTQALGVPFGYLCLLLCALCLDSSNREHISFTIKGDGLNRLWLEAEKCLHHMRIIDNDGFTDRFNAMMDRVKAC